METVVKMELSRFLVMLLLGRVHVLLFRRFCSRSPLKSAGRIWAIEAALLSLVSLNDSPLLAANLAP
jgi:hypothetical protein